MLHQRGTALVVTVPGVKLGAFSEGWKHLTERLTRHQRMQFEDS
ncbi:MAG: hypothetical protein KatS3mg082_3171 [Nitrospiraceae bacterium]|nr:MAG: hypothetical protein KatS3mg082_3171 [Nitrospiraceae bacterium]